jgi:hypothetical protein
MTSINEKTHTEISIGRVKIALPNTVQISDLYVQDKNADTFNIYIDQTGESKSKATGYLLKCNRSTGNGARTILSGMWHRISFLMLFVKLPCGLIFWAGEFHSCFCG